MTRTVQSLLFKQRRVHPGDAAFIVVSLGCFAAGLAMLSLPLHRISGPALAAIYATLPPRMLGVVWLIVGVLPMLAVVRPSMRTREWAYAVLLPLATGWTGGLFIPVLTRDVSNFWAPLLWAVVTSLGYIAYWLIPLDSNFYRRISTASAGSHTAL